MVNWLKNLYHRISWFFTNKKKYFKKGKYVVVNNVEWNNVQWNKLTSKYDFSAEIAKDAELFAEINREKYVSVYKILKMILKKCEEYNTNNVIINLENAVVQHYLLKVLHAQTNLNLFAITTKYLTLTDDLGGRKDWVSDMEITPYQSIPTNIKFGEMKIDKKREKEIKKRMEERIIR